MRLILASTLLVLATGAAHAQFYGQRTDCTQDRTGRVTCSDTINGGQTYFNTLGEQRFNNAPDQLHAQPPGGCRVNGGYLSCN